MRILAAEFLNSALADLPSHVACHVGLRFKMCESIGLFGDDVTFNCDFWNEKEEESRGSDFVAILEDKGAVFHLWTMTSLLADCQ